MPPGFKEEAKMVAHDRRTDLVKDMVARENNANDAKTARLRVLRLAKEAEEGAAAAQQPRGKPQPGPKN